MGLIGSGAVDEQGKELDILLQKRRDTAAAERCFKRILRNHPAPRAIVTDQLRSYPAAKARVPALAKTKHIFVRAAARGNNRAENTINRPERVLVLIGEANRLEYSD